MVCLDKLSSLALLKHLSSTSTLLGITWGRFRSSQIQMQFIMPLMTKCSGASDAYRCCYINMACWVVKQARGSMYQIDIVIVDWGMLVVRKILYNMFLYGVLITNFFVLMKNGTRQLDYRYLPFTTQKSSSSFYQHEHNISELKF